MLQFKSVDSNKKLNNGLPKDMHVLIPGPVNVLPHRTKGALKMWLRRSSWFIQAGSVKSQREFIRERNNGQGQEKT